MLLQYGLISEKKARTITQEETHKKSRGENRWALVAEEMSQQGFLEGSGDDIMETIRDFRDGFEIPMPGNKTAE